MLEEARPADGAFRILAATQGRWGDRIAANLLAGAPAFWSVFVCRLPPVLPVVVEDPDGFLADDLPRVDLLLVLPETAGAAQLIPALVERCGAGAVIAPIDRNEALPAGLARQIQGWLEPLGVTVVFPRPFCSLTCEAYNYLPVQVGYRHPLITEFASRFGSPAFSMEVSDGVIARAAVERDSACGCARHVAQGLVGIRVTDAVQEAGMLHAHYPCFASMNQDADYHDTLMHVSGHILQDAVRSALLPFLPPVAYVRPEGLVEADPHNDPGEA